MKKVEEILEVLEPWQTAMLRSRDLINKLRETIDPHPESELHKAFDELMHLATEQAAQIIGCNIEWLEVWWLENRFGDNPMTAQFSDSNEWHQADTLPELAALIHKDMQP